MPSCNTGVQTAEACLDWAEWTHAPDTLAAQVRSILDGPGEWRRGPGGLMGYHEAWRRGEAVIYAEGPPLYGVRARLDGQACRQLERELTGLDWPLLLGDLLHSGVRFNRVDLALDDRTGVLPLPTLCECVQRKWVVSPLRSRRVEQDCSAKTQGLTVVIGARSSLTQIHIYDKAARERTPGPWTRVELRTYQQRADELVRLMVEHGPGCVGGVLKRYLDFKVPGRHSQRERWPTQPCWEAFLGGCDGLRLASKRTPTMPANRKRWVETALPGALVDYEDVEGIGAVAALMEKERAKRRHGADPRLIDRA